ncbi:MAG: tRNA (guanosine(46)-N7)-methyltransferase TrmB [Cyanobacteria bacterium P01_D01_bin.73]
MAIVRVREHVNPLGIRFSKAIAPPKWETIFDEIARPWHLDIGCARGHFPLKMAAERPDWNVVGIEIREPLVDRANQWRDEAGLRNLYYLSCNANNSVRPILESLPKGAVQLVSVQFPDPWFKKRHQKRRVVQPPLVEELAMFLPMGAQVFLQSDVEEVAREMGDRFAANTAFQKTHDGDWLPENPLPVRTEREISVIKQGLPVYRTQLARV